MLLGFAALTVDIGYICNLCNETQILADTAALAGASAIGEDDSDAPFERAEQILTRNLKFFGHGLVHDQIVQVGTWDALKVTFTPGPTASANAVRVVGIRKEVPLFFAPIFGYHTTNVAREAVALTPRPCRGIWGLEEVTVPGTPITDSYDSTDGPYNNLTANSNGDICSGGEITVSGNTVINGDAMAAPGYPVTQNGSSLEITGVVTHWSGDLNVPPVDFGDAAVNNDNASIGMTDGGVPALDGGTLKIPATDNLTLVGGTYYFESIEFGQAKGAKLPGSLTLTGPTTIYITGDFNSSSQGVINTTGDPHDLTIISSGDKVGIRGAVAFYGSIFAPNADVQLVGDAHMYGGIIGRTVKMAGTFDFHVDESLPIHDLVTVAVGVVLVK